MFDIPMILLLFIILVVGLIFLSHPKFGLYCFIAYAPFSYYYAYLIRDKDLMIAGTFVQKSTRDFFILIVYLLWLFYILTKKQTKFPITQAGYLAIVFAIIIFIQVIWVAPYSPMAAFMGFRGMVGYLPLLFIVPTLFVDKNDLRKAVNILLSCSLLVCLLGFYEMYVMYSNIFTAFMLGLTRIHSTLFNPNNLGIYTASTLLILIALYIKKVYFTNKIISQILFAMLLVCMFFTFSRGAFLGFILGLIFLFIINGKAQYAIVSISVFVVIFLLINMVMPAMLTRYLRLIDFETGDNSVTGRQIVISSAFQMMIEKPQNIFMGLGFDRVTGSTDQIIDPMTGKNKWVGSADISTDNFYLSLFVGGGIIPFVIFCGILLSLLVQSVKISFVTSDMFVAGLSQGIGSVVFAQSFANATGAIWITFPGGFYFWLFAGMLIAIVNIVRKDTVNENRQLG